MKFDWLIVGAGFTGSTFAERLASQGKQKVLVIDRRNHIGGNAFDRHNEDDILVHIYGPHIFHTNSKEVWEYLSNFTEWRPYFHRVLGYVDGKQVPIPFNLDSLHLLFGKAQADRLEQLLIKEFGFGVKVPILKLRSNHDPELQFLADYVYKKVFLHYTIKQWGLRPEELDASVTGRVPIYISRDSRYFQDRYQAMPALGYTRMFENMLSHKNIKVMLNTSYQEIKEIASFSRIIYTGQIDEFFGYRFGHLPYRSLDFKFNTVVQERHQDVGTVNYPNEYDFTRITEQKYLSGQTNPHTTLVYEYPKEYKPSESEAYYPIPREDNNAIYEQYRRLAEETAGDVIFAGRLADYKYYNMDQACARALKIAHGLLEQDDA